MSSDLVYRSIHRYSTAKGIEEFIEPMVKEHIFDVQVNDQHCTRFVCTPSHIEELVVGHLALTGVINKYEDIESLKIKDSIIIVRTIPNITGSLPEEETQPDSKYYAQDILQVMEKHLNTSQLHRITGGVHTMSLAEGAELLVSMEDIGRHNAVDKLYGYCLMNNIDYRNKMFVSSGRITHEIIQKLVGMGIKTAISKAAVTSLAQDIAERSGITIVGFTRGEKFYIYAHPERIEIKG